MIIKQLHPWNVSPKEAIEIQKGLRSRLEIKELAGTIRYVAGADVSFSRKRDIIWAGIVVFGYPEFKKVEEKWITGRANFPYIPGLLSFRELPLLMEVFNRLETDPDLILCDGQGIAHPRGLGLASHLGLLLDTPTIGCAKSRLVGEFSDVGEKRGSYAHLWCKGHVVGAVLRTRQGVKPVFISPGNKITLDESLKMVLHCCGKYRIPEPTRQAHLLVNGLMRNKNT